MLIGEGPHKSPDRIVLEQLASNFHCDSLVYGDFRNVGTVVQINFKLDYNGCPRVANSKTVVFIEIIFISMSFRMFLSYLVIKKKV